MMGIGLMEFLIVGAMVAVPVVIVAVVVLIATKKKN